MVQAAHDDSQDNHWLEFIAGQMNSWAPLLALSNFLPVVIWIAVWFCRPSSISFSPVLGSWQTLHLFSLFVCPSLIQVITIAQNWPKTAVMILLTQPLYHIIIVWAEPNSNQGRPKLSRPAEFIQTPILIAAKLISNREKCSFRSNCSQKHYDNLCVRFGTWNVRRLNQSRSKVAPRAKSRPY